ncbi:uncharacterized protein [Palaemon carinicauda]|uniref:uncharacterized protein n=1 Tax=Palaemon carinicauda TaxID=392227 RepID=UPI0035B5B31C
MTEKKEEMLVRNDELALYGTKFLLSTEMNCTSSSSNHDVSNALEKGTNKRTYSCERCCRSFYKKSLLSLHIRSHTGEKPYNCNVCQKGFAQKGDLTRHFRLHTGEKPFKCDKCDRSFSHKSNLRQHQSLHNGERPFSCNYCGKSFSRMTVLRQHQRIHNGLKPYKCQHCQKAFPRRSALIQHIRLHTNDWPFNCELCNKGFSDRNHLVCHMRSHSGEKPFNCQYCKKAFSDKSNMKRHERRHTLSNRNGCLPDANTKSTITGPQKEKQRIRDDNHPDAYVDRTNIYLNHISYKCDHCLKEFNLKSNLTKHLRLHTGEQPYSCKYCCRSFSHKSNLTRHSKLHLSNQTCSYMLSNNTLHNEDSLMQHKYDEHHSNEKLPISKLMFHTTRGKYANCTSLPSTIQQEPLNTKMTSCLHQAACSQVNEILGRDGYLKSFVEETGIYHKQTYPKEFSIGKIKITWHEGPISLSGIYNFQRAQSNYKKSAMLPSTLNATKEKEEPLQLCLPVGLNSWRLQSNQGNYLTSLQINTNTAKKNTSFENSLHKPSPFNVNCFNPDTFQQMTYRYKGNQLQNTRNASLCLSQNDKFSQIDVSTGHPLCSSEYLTETNRNIWSVTKIISSVSDTNTDIETMSKKDASILNTSTGDTTKPFAKQQKSSVVSNTEQNSYIRSDDNKSFNPCHTKHEDANDKKSTETRTKCHFTKEETARIGRSVSQDFEWPKCNHRKTKTPYINHNAYFLNNHTHITRHQKGNSNYIMRKEKSNNKKEFPAKGPCRTLQQHKKLKHSTSEKEKIRFGYRVRPEQQQKLHKTVNSIHYILNWIAAVHARKRLLTHAIHNNELEEQVMQTVTVNELWNPKTSLLNIMSKCGRWNPDCVKSKHPSSPEGNIDIKSEFEVSPEFMDKP